MYSDPEFPETFPQSSRHADKPGRACDRCRKGKSKCIRPTDGSSCEYCIQNNAACTFVDPMYKRGTPKGYIKAVEQRLQLAETILASIIDSKDSASRSLINDLRKDPIADSILNRVRHGTYVANASVAPSAPQDVQANISPSRSTSHASDLGNHTSRESRAGREQQVVAYSFDDLQPPADWKTTLLACLNKMNDPGTSSRHLSSGQFNWSDSSGYALHDSDVDNSSMVLKQALPSSGRDQMPYQVDSSEITFLKSVVGNIVSISNWNTQVWFPQADINMSMTTTEVSWSFSKTEEQLLDLYFANIHPMFPMIRRVIPFSIEPGVGKEQDEFLALSIYAIASLYCGQQSSDLPTDAGNTYSSAANQRIALASQEPSLSVCQGLALLSYYDIAIGLAEQAWSHLGKAIQMAEAIGLRKTSDGEIEGEYGIGEEERRCTWWTLSILDKFLAWSLGRRPMILNPEAQYPLPAVSQSSIILADDSQTWSDGHAMKCFRKLASLSSIIGSILESLYNSAHFDRCERERIRGAFMTRLNKWLGKLSDDLRGDLPKGRPIPKLYVLTLHLWYWSAVALANRDFAFSNWQEIGSDPGLQTTLISGTEQLRVATQQVYNIATIIHDKYGFQASSPLISSFLFNAGITHLGNDTAMVEQILLYLSDLKAIWPSSGEKWQLLAAAKEMIDKNSSQAVREGMSHHLLHNEPPMPPKEKRETVSSEHDSGMSSKDSGSAEMAQMLGLQIPTDLSAASPNYHVDIDANQVDEVNTMAVPGFSQYDAMRPSDLTVTSEPSNSSMLSPISDEPQPSGPIILPANPGAAMMDAYAMMSSLSGKQPMSSIPEPVGGLPQAPTTASKQTGAEDALLK